MNSIKALKIWLIWGRTPQGTKMPLWSSTGNYGLKWTDPDFLIGYDSAVRARDHHRAEGLGFILPDGYCLLDIDSVALDSPGLQELIQEIDSYTELSPSGKGVHIIVKHGLGAIKNAVITTASGLTIEIKPNTYSTYTGNIIHDFPIKDATDLIRTTYKILDAGIEKSKMGIEATVAAKGGNRVLFPEAYIKAAILKECERVRAAAKGTRTNTLLSAASKLGRFQYSRNIIEEKLRSAARPTGLNDDKIKRTIEAGFRYNHLLI